MINQFINAFIFSCRNWNYGDAKHHLNFIDIDGPTVPGHFIHHIQRNYHRNIHFKELHCKVKISLYICNINNIDDPFRLFIKNKIP